MTKQIDKVGRFLLTSAAGDTIVQELRHVYKLHSGAEAQHGGEAWGMFLKIDSPSSCQTVEAFKNNLQTFTEKLPEWVRLFRPGFQYPFEECVARNVLDLVTDDADTTTLESTCKSFEKMTVPAARAVYPTLAQRLKTAMTKTAVSNFNETGTAFMVAPSLSAIPNFLTTLQVVGGQGAGFKADDLKLLEGCAASTCEYLPKLENLHAESGSLL